ncbi:hypothetical protein QUB13_10880 [Microcoleus sp. B4-D4]
MAVGNFKLLTYLYCPASRFRSLMDMETGLNLFPISPSPPPGCLVTVISIGTEV